MKCTIQEDRMSSLHIWKGWNRKIEQTGKYLYKAVRSADDEMDGEATVFLQGDDATSTKENEMTHEQRENLDTGYKINANIDDLYWKDS